MFLKVLFIFYILVIVAIIVVFAVAIVRATLKTHNKVNGMTNVEKPNFLEEKLKNEVSSIWERSERMSQQNYKDYMSERNDAARREAEDTHNG